ncbi:MAG: hypothetical protein RM021_023295 [Nostoc sp. EkiNYC01]|nr:hypothetical protein [Nostoc sp. EkiNYC01]
MSNNSIEFTQRDMDKLLADIRSGQLTEEKLITLLMLQNFAQVLMNAEINYFNSLLASFEGVKHSQKAIIEGISNSLKPHLVILEKLASLPQSEKNIRALAGVTLDLAKLQLEVNRTLVELNKDNNKTWTDLAKVAGVLLVVGFAKIVQELTKD